ncbi:BREX-2 system adenine-specific DNA-methyltransferase PglX [Parafrankia sp. FMc6]|uniref:BREX-2 system adenine-specific DNA-methyltransferase PglX n=1 Tax=Parafrankia soli TaxID=2599596 RepID=UPI0034D47B38
MKREFGKKLIEEYFAVKVEITHIIDTSGAYIPGHGTPTVIIAGRHNRWQRRQKIRAILGIRGEPSTPEDASRGTVWQAILEQIELPGSESEWVSVADLNRSHFNLPPWSLGGGGAGDLQKQIESASSTRLQDITTSSGITSVTGEDDLYILPGGLTAKRLKIEQTRPLVVGTSIRDYTLSELNDSIWPYREDFSLSDLDDIPGIAALFTAYRVAISGRKRFGVPMLLKGMHWYEWQEIYPEKLSTPLSICFAFVATHNNFTLDRGGKVFKQSAPVIKLTAGATEEEHLRLLGVLNSSTACFWLKQVSQPKGGSGIGRGVQDEAWESRYEFTGTKLEEFPLPADYPLELARELDELAQRLTAVRPVSVATGGVPTRAWLAAAQAEWTSTRARMIALQEELDWQVYRQYGLLGDELILPMAKVPEIKFGERAFEIALARQIAGGEETSEWFTRHGSAPITELPAHWPAEYRALVEKRIAVIETDRNIGLIERPEYKRRWATEGWDKLQDAALRDWLLDRLEARELWFADVDGMVQPRLWTTGRLADELAADADFVAVAEIYRTGEDLTKVVAGLVENEHVPFLAALRYKDSGLVKRADWESVWDQQRAEDAAPDEEAAKRIRDKIPVPPKYAQADFRKASYWKARGKLDVPKERFISYQPAGPDNDPTMLIGWAGWDHREQAQALATLIVERQDSDGWGAAKLTPLLAGLREVMPWVRQWHNDIDPVYDGSPAEVYDAFLAEAMGRHALTADALTGWRPQTVTRGRRATK